MNHETLFNEAQALESTLVADRRALHARAEVAFDLKETYDYVWNKLIEIGLEPKSCGRRGITCTLGNPGKVFLLRADMDGLPIQEETGLPFACEKGSMHACGHDMHTAMLLNAARLLKAHERELKGTVKLMFQPAEEPIEGSRDMIDAGVLENPRVDAAMMFHVMTNQPIPAGTVIISAPGVSAPAAGMFRIDIQGKGAHGAMPNTGIDPIHVAAHIVLGLEEINAREIGINESAALTLGMISSGANANVIPDTAIIRGNFRAYDDEVFQRIQRRIGEISEGTAATFRAKAKMTMAGSCPTLLNDTGMSAQVQGYVEELLGPGKVFGAAQIAGSAVSRSTGSEDFAAISHEVPSLMLALAAGEPKNGHCFPLHNPKTSFDEAALVPGSACYAWIAMRWLEDSAKD